MDHRYADTEAGRKKMQRALRKIQYLDRGAGLSRERGNHFLQVVSERRSAHAYSRSRGRSTSGA